MLRKVELAFVWLAAICVGGIGLLITATVLTRSLLGFGVPDDVVIVTELMVGAIVLPLAHVTAERAHIAVELLVSRFPARVQAWLSAFALAFAFLSLLPIVYAGWRELLHTVASEAYFFGDLELPEWPGRLAFFAGMLLFAVRLAVLFLHDLKVALRGGNGGVGGASPGQEGV